MPVNVDYDAIVIGAGFGGLRMLHELRSLGLSAKCFEAGSDVGGTWYWNRYPGARTDSEAWIYNMNISKELTADWSWEERLPAQHEVLEYLRHISDRFGLRQDVEFQTKVASATYNAEQNTWSVVTDKGSSYRCQFLITAVGPLSAPRPPPFPGVESFRGEWYQTSSWPKKTVDFEGKRVAVIGTGATAVQVIPIVAHEAKSVTVFQRTASYVIPGRNYKITEPRLREIRKNYDQTWEQARGQVFGMPIASAGRTISDVRDEAHHTKILERGWETGGFHFVFTTFDDILTDATSNERAAEFIRNKIRVIVEDEETAELLCPQYPFLAKRPPLGHFYYEAFNRPNVKLVDISKSPIQEMTPQGLRTTTDEYEFDIIIFAIGFDAATGALNAVDIRGENGVKLNDKWSESLETYLGIMVEGFPNMFMISGPQSPFANIPIVIDGAATWIGKAISHLQKNKQRKIAATAAANHQWAAHVDDVFRMTLLASSAPQVRSWYVGSNVPGKKETVLFYFGGVGAYFATIEKEADAGFPTLEKS